MVGDIEVEPHREPGPLDMARVQPLDISQVLEVAMIGDDHKRMLGNL